MLTELRVRDLAIISDSTLALQHGLNVLTGETGAGKSILVDALSLLLGERASADIVRPGAARALVEAAFDLGRAANVHASADQLGVDIEEGMLIVRRDINAEGRNRAWANGSPTTVGVLSTLGRSLVDLHGQPEAQSLLRPAAQRDILDAFGGTGDERQRVKEAHRTWAELKRRETELVERRNDVMKRADYLRHVVKEIEDIAPKPGEEEALATEAKRLANVEDLTHLSQQVVELLDGETESTAAKVMAAVRRTVDQLARIDESVARWKELLEAAVWDIEELVREVQDYSVSIERDPGRLTEVERRRDQIYRLLQKYGATVEAVLTTHDEARRELDVLDTADLDLEQIAERRTTAQRQLETAAAALTAARKDAAERLALAVEEGLPALGMPDATFNAELRTLDEVSPNGCEEVTFVVQLNKGLEPRPVAQVASGGELSRIMLALKVVLAAHDVVQTLVFDEVDQGVGGGTGSKIADALARVAKSRQVLVITHLPQIAALADHHLLVTKTARQRKAAAQVSELSEGERVRDTARMLGGDPGREESIEHARALLVLGDPMSNGGSQAPAP